MHIRNVSRVRPSTAYNLESILDIILQLIDVIERIETFLGIDFIEKFRNQS
jgi:hypothetical protein